MSRDGGRRKYMEDSTKGSSLIEPKTFKNDVYVQVWLESRYLATLSNWLDDEGVNTRFMSEVIREGIRVLVDNLVEGNLTLFVTDTEDARSLLFRKYRINLNNNDRGKKNVLHNKVLCDRLGVRKVEDNFPDEIKRKLELAHRIGRGEVDVEEANRCKDEAIGSLQFDEDGCAKFSGAGFNGQMIQQTTAVEKIDVEKTVKQQSDDRPRKLTQDEINAKMVERERKDREQLALYRQMSCDIPSGAIKDGDV